MLTMNNQKTTLLNISRKAASNLPISPVEISTLLNFEKRTEDGTVAKLLKHVALPVSLVVGFFFAAFPDVFDSISHDLPTWTNLSNEAMLGLDYFWNILGEPVEKSNIIFHLPNVILYSFGIAGIKNIIDSISRRTWLDKVLDAQLTIKDRLQNGTLSYQLNNGHSLLFIGQGDYIGMQHVLSHKAADSITISQIKPHYTQIWNYYDSNTQYEDLKEVLLRCGGKNAGEYIFFPVKDDQIFLPNEKAYDLSPHKLDILCQNIRTVEKEYKWPLKRILIIGDKFHKSYVHSVDQRRVIPRSADTISLSTLSKKYNKVSLLDPTDIVLKKILSIANGRKIILRATKEGILEYKNRFYSRLKLMGYRKRSSKNGVLTIGYDLFEDQTEQQTLSRVIDDYYPVVLSKNVRDALIRNGYKSEEFIYVPDLVLKSLSQIASEQ